MAKIISFCIYGSNPKYVNSALKNILLQERYYPGWRCRFYVDDSVPEEFKKELQLAGGEVERKSGFNDHRRMFWRFEPFKDSLIERFIVRDTDSRLNPREADAVHEWIESGKKFHIIRDHEQHGAPILGGLWGATNELILEVKDKYDNMVREYFKSLDFLKVSSHPRGPYFNTDQPFLWKWIWPLIVNDHIAHIKDLPNLRFTGKEKLLKIKLPNNGFCGQDVNYED